MKEHLRFIIVDDSAVDRRFLASILEEMGHQVEAYDSTTGIIEKLITGEYDSVFLDIVMPEKDGYKFLRELRLNQRTVNQHVIFYSSKKTPVEVSYGIRRAGANDYLTKPITRERLEQTLQEL
ncbi:response regulator [Allocoleopsis franciscana]|uniref:Response regulator with CheY-like receiver, AAA-type ATPase, and DNA-binding domains n=1 Tax=Allocoleopsis franciscana PCC 7113 TaxID=1173027 RepID=K9WJZ8_9CYAN|nr:response regulator [Allocoleopsis franciscana]AFZ20740.1 response regulator with CheY-like receiver, AAA-type ATPase, and DNA-binding domains [Allocoleopsis franciscana PCC 7113]